MILKQCPYCHGQSPTCIHCNDEGTINEKDIYKSQSKGLKKSEKQHIIHPVNKKIAFDFTKEKNSDKLIVDQIKEAKGIVLRNLLIKLRERQFFWKNEITNLRNDDHIKKIKEHQNELRIVINKESKRLERLAVLKKLKVSAPEKAKSIKTNTIQTYQFIEYNKTNISNHLFTREASLKLTLNDKFGDYFKFLKRICHKK